MPDLATRTSDHRKRETYGELGLGARNGRKEEKGIVLPKSAARRARAQDLELFRYYLRTFG